MSGMSISRISNVQQLLEMLQYVEVPDILYVITKNGQRIGGNPVMGYNGVYCIENDSDEWTVYYEDQTGQRKIYTRCKQESQACKFFYSLLAEYKTHYHSPYPEDYNR